MHTTVYQMTPFFSYDHQRLLEKVCSTSFSPEVSQIEAMEQGIILLFFFSFFWEIATLTSSYLT